MLLFTYLQDLPAETVEEDLIETKQAEEVLLKPCPPEYSSLKEEEVRKRDFTLGDCLTYVRPVVPKLGGVGRR